MSVTVLATPPCLNRGLNGLGDYADYPTPPHRRFVLPLRCVLRMPYRHSPIPPAPVIRFAHCRLRLCLQGKGERMAFLKVCIQGCFDGFERMEHAIEPQTPLAQSLAKPFAIPPSS